MNERFEGAEVKEDAVILAPVMCLLLSQCTETIENEKKRKEEKRPRGTFFSPCGPRCCSFIRKLTDE